MGILKARNILGIVSVGYAVLALGIVFSEFSHIKSAVSDAYTTVSLASDAALSQVVASDEFFSSQEFNHTIGSTKYATEGVTTIKLARTLNSSYTDENIFSVVYGYNETGDYKTDKERLYKNMYGSSYSTLNNPAYMGEIMNLTFTVNGKNIPQIARLGLLQGWSASEPTSNAVLQGAGFTALHTQLQSLNLVDGYSNDPNKYSIQSDWLNLFDLSKEVSDEPNSDVYFLAPTNVGITYVDPALLQTAFVCNMDLLMRAKAEDVSAVDDYKGIPSSGYDGKALILSEQAKSVAEQQNIINNGTFAFVKGAFKNYTGIEPGGFTGGMNKENKRIFPRIEYKCIDLADIRNAPLVYAAIGIESNNAGDTYTYEDWLDDIGVEKEGGAYKSKYCVVAKITYYADIIIPYKSSLARELYTMFERDNMNTADKFFQVNNIPLGTSVNNKDVSAITNNEYYQYTTYYAIVP